MLAYLFYLTLCWAILAFLYVTLLRKETFFHVNRFYLLGALGLGLFFPILKDMLHSAAMIPSVYLLPEVVVGIQRADTTLQVHGGWEWWITAIWAIGVVWMAARFIWGIKTIVQMIFTAEKRLDNQDITLVYHEKAVLPFSFFKWVFIAPGMEEDAEIGTMIAHERAHADGWHTLDILCCEALCVLFWWHPLVYWYKNAVRAVHEYIADEATANQFSRKQYGLLLIRHAQSGPAFALANHFFQSPLKQRLVMLTKKASAPVRAFRYALVIPALIFLFICSRQPALSAQVAGTEKKTETTKTAADKAASPDPENGTSPEYPGGMEAFFKYISQNMVYPEAARKDKAEGMVVVSFTVNKKGRVENATATKSVRPDMDAEAIRVIKSTQWTPGTQDGKKVNVELCVPIKFKLE